MELFGTNLDLISRGSDRVSQWGWSKHWAVDVVVKPRSAHPAATADLRRMAT